MHVPNVQSPCLLRVGIGEDEKKKGPLKAFTKSRECTNPSTVVLIKSTPETSRQTRGVLVKMF